MKLCKRGHPAEGRCKKCHSIAQQKYAHTLKGKAATARYQTSLKGKACIRASRFRRYHYSEIRDRILQRSRERYAKLSELRREQFRRYGAKMRAMFGSNANAFWARQEKNSV